jgi:hypothetical protein
MLPSSAWLVRSFLVFIIFLGDAIFLVLFVLVDLGLFGGRLFHGFLFFHVVLLQVS